MTYFTVRFGVADSLIDDGFNPTVEMFERMIQNAIPHADTYQTSAEMMLDDTDFELSVGDTRPACDYSNHNSPRR